LDAAVACLVDHGYAGTSTAAVCRRADCSRGTLQYHFPDRASLLVAALHKVLADRVAQFVASTTEPITTEQFLRRLWAQWQDAPFTAWLELAVASRTDADLREPLRQTMETFDELVYAAFDQLLPGATLPPPLDEQAPSLIFAVFNGMAVARIYEAEGAQEPLLAVFTQLGSAVWPGPVGGAVWTS
jgi:AcrR family transcriptional regulator